MHNLYDTSKGQVITLWIFGIFGWIWSILEVGQDRPLFVAFILIWAIPFALIFYTLGWKNNKKK